MRRLLFVPALGVAALALTAPAQAQTRGWLDEGRPYPAAQESYYSSGRIAYDNGFREGIAHGEHDARDRRDFRVDRDSDYRHADDGYRREYGDRAFYRQSFRRGYEAGYRQGYQRFARRW